MKITRTDGLLILMTVIWGANYTIVKVALQQIPPLTFNSLRLGLASLLFLVTLASRPASRRSTFTTRDWALTAAYGLIGHFVYQVCFLFGLERTTVANSSLILGCSPVVVALLAAAAGHERVKTTHWIGATLSVCGIYLVVGRGAALDGSSLFGDLLTIGGLFCWGVYTVGAKDLLDRHSPLEVTGYSMAFGTVPYVLMSVRELYGLAWRSVDLAAWVALASSGVFALFVAYLIWYAAVQRIGNVRTSMYSNLTPVCALVIAVAWLGEPWTGAKVVGAGAILAGMAIARLAPSARVRAMAPAEE